MSANGHSNGELDGLDVTKRADRVLIQTACYNRWPIPKAVRLKLMDLLDSYIPQCRSVRDASSLAKTYAMLDRLNAEMQANEDKQARLDAGLPTDHVHIKFTFASPVGDLRASNALPEAGGGRL